MARTPHDVTDTELAILQLLWDGGAVTIRHLTDALSPLRPHLVRTNRRSERERQELRALIDQLEPKGKDRGPAR
jgi:hypothetical protein